MNIKKILIVCTTDSMIWNFLVPHIDELKKKGFSVECASSVTGYYYEELINQFEIKMHQVDFERSPFSTINISAYRKLRKIINAGRFDFIFCHEPVGGMMGRLAGKSCGKKVIYMAHGFHFFKGASLKHWLLYFTAEYILSFLTDACITINKEDYLASKKMHAKKKYYIHGIGIQPKINESLISPERLKEELGLEDSDVVLMTVGELSERKNHRVILEAMHLLNQSNIKLVICGEGALRGELIATCERYDLLKSVVFTGFIKNVGDYLNICDIFIYPSLWEGLGIAGLEAMAKELSIIGSNRRGIRDYVIHGRTGLLFEPHDAQTLAEEIQTLLDNPPLKRKLIKNSHKILSKFGLKNVKEELELIYQKEFISKN